MSVAGCRRLQRTCPNVCELRLSSCRAEAVLQLLACYAHQLKRVELRGLHAEAKQWVALCAALTSCTTLQALSLDGVSGFSDDDASVLSAGDALLRHVLSLPSLEQLLVDDGCGGPGLTNALFRRLIERHAAPVSAAATLSDESPLTVHSLCLTSTLATRVLLVRGAPALVKLSLTLPPREKRVTDTDLRSEDFVQVVSMLTQPGELRARRVYVCASFLSQPLCVILKVLRRLCRVWSYGARSSHGLIRGIFY